MAQSTIEMDKDGPEHRLQYAISKEAYFHSCHFWCGWYKTLVFFVYHPAMQYIYRHATMEVKNESTCEIIVFSELFNEILSDI